MVTGGNEGTLWLWDADGGLVSVLSQTAGFIWSAGFSPDGTRIVAAGAEGLIWLWDADGNLLKVLRGFNGIVYSARFSPDSTRLVTADQAHTALLWDAQGNLLDVFDSDIGNIYSASISSDGLHLLTVGSTTRVWNIADYQSVDSMLAAAQRRTGRTLTPDECRQYLHAEQCP